MTPIKWKVTRDRADPTKLSKRLVDGGPTDGVVFAQSPRKKDGTLRFAAVAACGDETPLLMGLIAAFSASEGIRKDTGIISWVRWPGTVTIAGRTVATASAIVTTRAGGRWAELDFRVNVLHSDQDGATSLYEELGVEVDRNLLLEKILESLSWMHFGWSNGMRQQLLRRVRSMTETIGGRVFVRRDGREVSGLATSIDPLGRLEVRLDDGGIARLSAGGELLRA